MYINYYFALSDFGVITLYSFYTSNFVQTITLKLQDVSRKNFVDRYISLSRSAVHKHRKYALPSVKIIALKFMFTLWILSWTLLWNC